MLHAEQSRLSAADSAGSLATRSFPPSATGELSFTPLLTTSSLLLSLFASLSLESDELESVVSISRMLVSSASGAGVPNVFRHTGQVLCCNVSQMYIHLILYTPLFDTCMYITSTSFSSYRVTDCALLPGITNENSLNSPVLTFCCTKHKKIEKFQ